MEARRSWRRLRRIFRRDPGAEFDDELRFHIDERVRDYVARGMDPESARRATLERLGDLEGARLECTTLLSAERSSEEKRMMLNVSWLDVKLGVRMLAKYPGLSVVSGLGLSLAIALGAGWFGFLHALFDPSVPLDDGDRIVSIRNRDTRVTYGRDFLTFSETDFLDQTLHDFIAWRAAAMSIEDLGAFRTSARNLLADGTAALVQVAEMSASGFRIARVPALLGRWLSEDDEWPGAPPVVVIGYEEWQHRFRGDPAILGRQLRFAGVDHTVVGVMPEDFRFPLYHEYWVPLHLDPLEYERARSPRVNVFGRLADGVSLEKAQAELTTIGARIAADLPESREHMRPRVLPYAFAFFSRDPATTPWSVYLIQNIYLLLIILVAVNVAVLIYARTATRRGEIAVRNALGASRRRILGQLFIEALVLALVAAALGLALAAVGLKIADDVVDRASALPFWIDIGLSPVMVAYAVVLALIAAFVVGVLPALKATGRRVQAELQLFSTRRASLQLGATWTALIVLQVGITVALMPGALYTAIQTVRDPGRPLGYPADEIVRASLSLDDDAGTGGAPPDSSVRRAMLVDRMAALRRRLDEEPAVTGVTFGREYPGYGPYVRFEVAPASSKDIADTAAGGYSPGMTAPTLWRGAIVNDIDIGLFDVFGVPILTGRGFTEADRAEGATTVIVSRSMAEAIAAGGDVVGRRIREVAAGENGVEQEARPWLDIVGVVPDFPSPPYHMSAQPQLYRPFTVGAAASLTLAVRVRAAEAPAFTNRLRELAAVVDPTIILQDLESLAVLRRNAQEAGRYGAIGIIGGTMSVLLLSAAGIYAMMAFTVTRRRREIGVRSALGADARRILAGTFARAAAQLSAGIVVGVAIATALSRGGSTNEFTGDWGPVLVPVVAAIMLVVGLLAALGPARRGLAIQPTEALREE